MRTYLKRFGPKSYDVTTTLLSVQIRMRKAEAKENVLHGCVTWTLSEKCFAKLRNTTKSSYESVASSADNVRTTPPSRTRRSSRRQSSSASTSLSVNGGALFESRGAAKRGAITRLVDTRDDSRWGGPETGPTIAYLAEKHSRCSPSFELPRGPRNTPGCCVEFTPRCGPLQQRGGKLVPGSSRSSATVHVVRWDEEQAKIE